MNERITPAVVSGLDYSNVKENWPLFDTVLIGLNAAGEQTTPGWYPNLNAMGQSNQLFFFNQRTRADGLAYCNLDTRDQMPYAFIIASAGVRFFASYQTENPDVTAGGAGWWTENVVAHAFLADLPNHCSFRLQIQQDDILKTAVPLVPSGYGPCGGGYGQTAPSSEFEVAVDKCYSAVTQSSAHITNRWKFPTKIKVPRNAALTVELQFSEYARQWLQTFTKQNTQDAISGNGHVADIDHDSKTFYGIQVSLIGQRLIQQRAQYHA